MKQNSIVKSFTLADDVLSGSYPMILKAKGYEIGNSLVGESNFQIHFSKKQKLVLPEDVVVSDTKRVTQAEDVCPMNLF